MRWTTGHGKPKDALSPVTTQSGGNTTTLTETKVDADIEEILQRAEERSRRWSLLLFNDEHHSMDQVAHQVMKAIRCTQPQAMRIMMEAHEKGQAVVLQAPREDCEHAQRILQQIQLVTDLLAVD